ncbi:DUF4870 domain-containing protein [Bacillaceae bacterium S4-13-58]
MGDENKDRDLASIPHVLTFVPLGPFNILVSLIYWLIMRERSPFIEQHARSNVNLLLSMYLYGLIGFAILFMVYLILSFFPEIEAPVILFGFGLYLFGFLFILLQILYMLITLTIAIVRALLGKEARYPLTIKFVK